MDLVKLECIAADCNLCGLCNGRIKPVFAKGNPTAKIMICGMVPANEENIVGKPFVGRAGQLLDEIMKDTDIHTDEVYITNLVKCYLAAGLPLKQEWIDACLPYLIVQINLIKPKVILTLGKDASLALLSLDNKTAMSDIRGKVFEHGDVDVIPTYHPSYLLRGGGMTHKKYSTVKEDFLRAKNLV